MDSEYNHSLYNFQALQKGVIRDKKVKIYVFDHGFVVCKEEKQKYSLNFDLRVIIQWVVRKQKSGRILLEGFIFKYERKSKTMLANPFDLLNFRQLLSTKVSFSKVADFYEPLYCIGKGMSSKVVLCRSLVDNEYYAVKSVDKKYLNSMEFGMVYFNLQTEAQFMNEINFIRTLQRYNTQKRRYFPHLFEFYDSEGTFYLSQEMMEGKTLGLEIERRKKERKSFTEEEVKIILLNILQAIDLMHEAGIIHRDIKPDNIMFTVKGDLRTVRIVDFGLATLKNVDKFIFPRCGTPGYAAPEILNLTNKDQIYSEKCDLFSVGSLLYKLFTFTNLFKGKVFEDQLKLNKECEISFETPEFLKIPQDGQDLIKKLLEKDPEIRLSAKEALGHPFLFMESIKEYEPSKEVVEFIYMDDLDEKINDTFKS